MANRLPTSTDTWASAAQRIRSKATHHLFTTVVFVFLPQYKTRATPSHQRVTLLPHGMLHAPSTRRYPSVALDSRRCNPPPVSPLQRRMDTVATGSLSTKV